MSRRARPRAIGYVRVSTDRQAERGLGLEVQREAIVSWCHEQRRHLVDVLADEGLSGSAGVGDRPALASALAAIADRRAVEVVVYRLDRIARDLVLQEWIRSDVVRAGGTLRSCSPTEDTYLVDDPDDPTGQLVRQILGAVAEYERAMIRLRMRAGLERKRSAGGYAGGRPSYGWAAVRGDLVPVLDEQRILERVRRSRGRGASWRQITRELTAAGALTRSGTEWTPSGLSRVIDIADKKRKNRPQHRGQKGETMSAGP